MKMLGDLYGKFLQLHLHYISIRRKPLGLIARAWGTLKASKIRSSGQPWYHPLLRLDYGGPYQKKLPTVGFLPAETSRMMSWHFSQQLELFLPKYLSIPSSFSSLFSSSFSSLCL